MEPMEDKSAGDLLKLGIKAFWAANYKHSVRYLSKTTEMLCAEYKDDKHDSLGEAYLYYGKTLLELSREEGDPFGDAVPKEVGRPDDTAEADGEDDDDKEAEATSTASKDSEATKTEDATKNAVDDDKNSKKEDKDTTKKDKSDEEPSSSATEIKINGESASSTTEKTDEKMDADDSGADGSDGGAEEAEGEEEDEDGDDDEDAEDVEGEEKEEEPSDLQLAWEVLELAKIVLERRGDTGKGDYADCLVTLGEVSLESENFDSAIADIKAGLEIQQTLYKGDLSKSRRVAETYYKLGLAHATNNQPDQGVKAYGECLELLKKRVSGLKDSANELDKEQSKEIEALIPEIEEKIADLKTYKEELAKKAAANPNQPSSSGTTSSPSKEKKINDITHLVKRKRKIEEAAAAADEPAVKKPSP